MLHPVSLLVSWLAFVLILQWLPLYPLMGLAALCLVLALTLAAERSRNLLMRSRWLLLSLALLFLLLTPGEYLPGPGGDLGLTYEGLRHTGEQLSRLLAMLSSLALLHQQVGTLGLLTAFYCLLRPFSWRERTVVRLMLVLEFVEQRQKIDWREWFTLSDSHVSSPKSFSLPMPPLRLWDKLLIGSLLAMIPVWTFWP